MDDIAGALARYDQAIGNGQPQELFGAADSLSSFLGEHAVVDADRIRIAALILHLRGVACLSTDDDDQLAECFDEALRLAAADPFPAVQAVHAILTFCSYYTTHDLAILSEALRLFAARDDTSAIPRLETAALINEVRTHSLALTYNVPGHSADRVEALVRRLCSNPLAPRLEAILADTISAFYGRLAAIYGDVRFVRQGVALLEPMLQRDTSTVTDAALGAVWHLLTIGLEYDGDFAIPRELILRSQRRVRQLRSDASPTSREVGSIAAGLALRARFDWERYGKRTGVQRALAYLRLASRERAHETLYATTLRVGYEAGLGDNYLQESLAVFEQMRARPGFRPNTPDDTNFASTLMLVANEEKDPSRLLQAIELYEASIAREPDSATNVSRYINFASAVRSFVRLAARSPEAQEMVDDLLHRGLDAVIWVEVLDRPGSTHAGMHQAIASSYYSLFGARLGDAAEAHILERTVELFAGREDRWPIGFSRHLAKRIVAACEGDYPDCDLLMRCAEALGRAKLLLQVIDLCDGGDALTDEIDAMFAAAVAMLRHFIAYDRDGDGLRVVDQLTAGFVRHVTAGPDLLGDDRSAGILRKAIAGEALSPDDIARIRRSSLGSFAAAAETASLDIPEEPRVDLLRAGGQILALRRDADGLAARLFGARGAALSSSDPEAVARIAGFCLEAAGTPLVGFRNFQPVAAHELFNALRAEVETRQPGRRLLRHAARSLGAPLAPIHWTGSSGAPRFLVAHSPTNGARSLSFGFTLVSRMRELGADVVDLSLDDCRRDAITRHLPAADVVLVVSHGERGASDRILLAGDDYADASWLLGLGDALNGKCLFLVACNSGHFNARLTHDDIGLASLAIGLGARGVFSTLRSVDELSILLLVSAALESWRDGVPLGLALDSTRTTMLGLDEAGWGEAIGEFVRPSPGAHSAARNPLDAGEASRLAADRADVDVGWSFVLG